MEAPPGIEPGHAVLQTAPLAIRARRHKETGVGRVYTDHGELRSQRPVPDPPNAHMVSEEMEPLRGIEPLIFYLGSRLVNHYDTAARAQPRLRRSELFG